MLMRPLDFLRTQSAKKVAVWPQPEEAPGTTLSLYSDLYAAEAAEANKPTAASARAALQRSLTFTVIAPLEIKVIIIKKAIMTVTRIVREEIHGLWPSNYDIEVVIRSGCSL